MKLIKIEFSIWLASKTKWVQLTKDIRLTTVPRVGEFIKFDNSVVGDYFPWKVKEVTYRESGKIEISTDLLNNIEGRMYSFEEDTEFFEYYDSYINEGWQATGGVKPNRHFIENLD